MSAVLGALLIVLVVWAVVMGRFVLLRLRRPSPAQLAAERWSKLKRELAADPALARARQVADSYVAGQFGPEELEWRILLALVPPPPDREARVRQWDLAQKAATQRMLEQQQAMQRAGVVVGGHGAIVAFPTHTTTWTAAAPGTAVIPWSADPGSNGRQIVVHTPEELGLALRALEPGDWIDWQGVGPAPVQSQFPRPRMEEIGH